MARTAPMPTIQYLYAEDIMACVGVGRTTAYRIIKALNAELESEGFLTFPGKVPEKKFRERLYLPENIRPTLAANPSTTTKRR